MEEWRYRELYELEDRHWWFRSRRRVVRALLEQAELGPAPRILDAGCGTGRNLVEYAAFGPVEGVDFSADAVEFCRLRGLEGVRQAALEQLPFEADRFDLIVATDVIEHLDDDRLALAELGRVAAPGGRLVLTVPAYRWLWSQHDESLHHKRRYTATLMRQQLEASGWTPRFVTYFFTALLPGVAAVRAFRRGGGNGGGGNGDGGDGDGGDGDGGESDCSLGSPGVGRLLELPSHGEAKLIERGVRLPAGVSLGVVARAPG